MVKLKSPLFSILIANYNNGRYLKECLQSIFYQTYSNWEVILVDDASTDNLSFEIYEKYKVHPQVHIFYNPTNKGCGYTKRTCVEKANGQILGFLDPDDALTADALEIMVSEHLLHPGHSLIYSTHYLCDEHLNINSINGRVQQVDKDGYFCSIGKQVSHFATFKKKSYILTEGINPQLKRAVDQDLYYILDEVGKFHFVDRPLYYYRIHENGISTNSNALRAMYWHLTIMQYTYLRRKQKKVPNIDKNYLNNRWIHYYTKSIYFNLNEIKFDKKRHLGLVMMIFRHAGLNNILHSIKLLLLPIKRIWVN